MTTLKNVITAFQREIEDALHVAADASHRSRLVADKVILNLEVVIDENDDANGSSGLKFKVAKAPDASADGRTHALTIEFRPVAANPLQAVRCDAPTETLETTSKASARLEQTDAVQVIEALSSVFGAPGFDSSARATVFREVFSDLEPAQVSNLLAAFSGDSSSAADPGLRSAIQRINGILRSGPQRSPEGGKKILATVFAIQSHAPILKVIEETWKTQEDWLDAPMPAAKPEQPN